VAEAGPLGGVKGARVQQVFVVRLPTYISPDGPSVIPEISGIVLGMVTGPLKLGAAAFPTSRSAYIMPSEVLTYRWGAA
jgi:hypothetical protein